MAPILFSPQPLPYPVTGNTREHLVSLAKMHSEPSCCALTASSALIPPDTLLPPTCLAASTHLGIQESLAHLLAVASASIALLLDVHSQELSTHALGLLLDSTTGVEDTDNGAEALGGANSGEAGDTAADHQHLGGGHAARGGDLAAEETAWGSGGRGKQGVRRAEGRGQGC